MDWPAWIHPAAHPWLDVVASAVPAVVLAFAVHALGALALRRAARGHSLAEPVIRAIAGPSRWLLVLVAILFILHASADELRGAAPVRHGVSLLLIAVTTWLCVAALRSLGAAIEARHPIDVADNLHARQVRTQTRVLVRTGVLMLVLVGFGMALLTFPGVKQIGASVLASAGVVGIVAGFAARPVLGNVIAGLQIALTQPIRIDDVLIVEGEWGRVEEITGAFVVVRIWDQRRLVVPLQWFIEHPFENWTRRGAELIGTVFLWLDYRAPMEPLRAELKRIVEGDPDWDGRVCQMQVTNANERAVEVRALVSAADAGRAFSLRCRVREALIGFVQREHPEALPQVRHIGTAAA